MWQKRCCHLTSYLWVLWQWQFWKILIYHICLFFTIFCNLTILSDKVVLLLWQNLQSLSSNFDFCPICKLMLCKVGFEKKFSCTLTSTEIFNYVYIFFWKICTWMCLSTNGCVVRHKELPFIDWCKGMVVWGCLLYFFWWINM